MDQAQTSDDFAAIERQILELAAQNVRAAQERADAETAVSAARARVASVAERLPAVEALAKKRRQARHDAVRDRAEIERRLSALLEEENSARSRRRQAEQLAEGFRSAEAFAAASGSEAQRGGDGDRMMHENSVASRARIEAQQAQARVAELRQIEDEITRNREEVEGHVLAEREFESKLAADRDETEAEAAALRAELLAAKHAYEEARETLERLDHEAQRVVGERSEVTQRLLEARARARAEIEGRIRALREEERELAARRAAEEKVLAALLQAENRANAEITVRERDEAKRLTAERNERARAERAERERAAAEALDASERQNASDAKGPTPTTHAANNGATSLVSPEAGAAPATPPPVAPPKPPTPTPAPAAASPKPSAPPSNGAPPPRPAAAASANRDEPSALSQLAADSPILRGLISLFGRKSAAAPEEPALDGPSIADRIARDFGALGSDNAPQAPTGSDARAASAAAAAAAAAAQTPPVPPVPPKESDAP